MANSERTLDDNWFRTDELVDPDLLGDDHLAHSNAKITGYANLMGFELDGSTRKQQFQSLKNFLRATLDSNRDSSKRGASSSDSGAAKRNKVVSFTELMQQSSAISSLGDRIEATADRLLLTAATALGNQFLVAVTTTQIGTARIGDFLFALLTTPAANYAADSLVSEPFTVYKLTSLPDQTGMISIEFVQSVNCDHEPPSKTNRVSIRRFACLKGQLAQMYGQMTAIGTKEAAQEAQSKLYYDSFDGKQISYLDKTKLVERVHKSRIARRMVATSVLESWGPSVIDFDGSSAWSHLITKGRSWIARDTEEVQRHLDLDKDDTSHYFKMLDPTLPCMSSGRVFELIFDKGVELTGLDNTRFPISLQDFSAITLDHLHDFTTKQSMIQACLNLEHWLLFTTGPGMKDVTLDIRERLGVKDFSTIEWEADYVRYLIEKTLHEVVYDVQNTRNETYLLLHPSGTSPTSPGTTGTTDITSHLGVSAILRKAFHDIPAMQAKQTLFLRMRDRLAALTPPVSVTPKTFTFNAFAGKYGAASLPPPTPASMTAGVALPAAAPLKGNGGLASSPPLKASPASHSVPVKEEPNLERVCKGHLLHKLQVPAPGNGQPWHPCANTSCKYPHHDIFKLTRKQVHTMVDILPSPSILSEELKAAAHKAISSRQSWRE